MGYETLQKLGKYKTGKRCVYIRKLDDIDENILKELIIQSVRPIEKMYGENK